VDLNYFGYSGKIVWQNSQQVSVAFAKIGDLRFSRLIYTREKIKIAVSS
jgi:hypothetical protein